MSHEIWILFDKDRVLLFNDSGVFSPLSNKQISPLLPACTHQHLIGQDGEAVVFCGEVVAETSLPREIEAVPLRKALNLLGERWYGMVVRAYSILLWDKNHHFCGHCGKPTQHKPGTFERICTACSLTMYPRISPSVIVRITKGNQIMMARSPHFTPGAYGLIAGFVEVGENLEQAVHREVKEEIGITITNLRYFGSQPWPFPDSLMVGFTADYLSGELVIDHTELETAGWFTREEIPGWPSSSISISRKLIDDFIHSSK